jgi:predicted HTH domain antitoxin
MTVTLDIPDEILATLPTAPPERAARLLLELAVALYAKGMISLTQGAAMAGMTRFDFGVEVGRSGIPRHYSAADLNADFAYARGE